MFIENPRGYSVYLYLYLNSVMFKHWPFYKSSRQRMLSCSSGMAQPLKVQFPLCYWLLSIRLFLSRKYNRGLVKQFVLLSPSHSPLSSLSIWKFFRIVLDLVNIFSSEQLNSFLSVLKESISTVKSFYCWCFLRNLVWWVCCK